MSVEPMKYAHAAAIPKGVGHIRTIMPVTAKVRTFKNGSFLRVFFSRTILMQE